MQLFGKEFHSALDSNQVMRGCQFLFGGQWVIFISLFLFRLTAFVNKVFCQAREFIKDHIDENIVCQSAQFLLNQQSDDGKFVEKQAVIHREMTV